jgi:hypothetical protein
MENVNFCGILWYITCKGEYNKIEIFKMAASHFVEVTDKEISEIKINSVPRNRNTKSVFVPIIILMAPSKLPHHRTG